MDVQYDINLSQKRFKGTELITNHPKIKLLTILRK